MNSKNNTKTAKKTHKRSVSNIHKKKVSKTRTTLEHHNSQNLDAHNNPNASSYKNDLLEINQVEKNYDKVFQEKLSEEYMKFRNTKDHEIQIRKFLRAFSIILIIILVVMLLLTFG